MVESSGLLNRRSAIKRYRGFESPPLRQNFLFRTARSTCRVCIVSSLVYIKELMPDCASEIRVIDSHTEGEPTRVIVAGGPPLSHASLFDRVQCFRTHYDHFRSAVVNEPRGSDAVVGALLCEPADPSCAVGVIFFNNVGYLGMCGHGTIGVATTLAHLGRIQPGTHVFETPVGLVRVELHKTGEVTFENVASYRLLKDVELTVAGARIKGESLGAGTGFF